MLLIVTKTTRGSGQIDDRSSEPLSYYVATIARIVKAAEKRKQSWSSLRRPSST
jgi:hypothetical protein